MILNRLRLETREQHDKLDQHPLLVQLMSPHVSHSLYQHILAKFLGFYQPLEPQLTRFSVFPQLGLLLEERQRTPWLLQDLMSLGVPMTEVPQAPVPDWIVDEASAMGTFYVMEGSTLGGQVITRHIKARLGLTGTHGLRFFSSYGEDVGLRWKETREALVKFSELTAADDAMILAAKRTFEALGAWLDSKPDETQALL